MKTILIGLGNPILGDDGVGWKVAQEFSKCACSHSIEIDCLSIGGLALMERLVGYDQLILVDAIQTGQDAEGTITVRQLEDFPYLLTEHMNSIHDVNFATALQLGREMGVNLPKKVYIVCIEAQHVYDFSEELSPSISAVITQAVQRIENLLQMIHHARE